jgi:hypothetical protein
LNSGTNIFKVNGSVISLGNLGSEALADIRLFGHHADTQYNGVGYMYEVVVYESALDAAELITNESYLNTKWNIF